MLKVKPATKYVEIDGTAIIMEREAAGLSQKQFARLCGWSQQRQSYLEGLGKKTVKAETVLKICKALSIK